MPNQPGVDIALLSKIKLASEVALAQSQQTQDAQFVADKTIRKLLEKQKSLNAAAIQYLTDPTKDHEVEIMWQDLCNQEAVDCVTDVCTGITGAEPTGQLKSYKITQCVEASFMVDEAKFANSTENITNWIATTQAAKIKSLVERLDLKAVAFLHAKAAYNGGGQYPFAANVTTIPAADYNLALVAKLLYDAEVNKMAGGFLIDGGKLFIPVTNAKLDSGNGEGKGDAARTGVFDYTYDIQGFAKAGLSDRTFLVSPYAYAIANKNYIPNTAPEFDPALGTRGMYKYSMDVPGYDLKIDVFHERVCVDGNKNQYAHKFLYKLWYGIFDNPTGCELVPGTPATKVSGIVEYKVA